MNRITSKIKDFINKNNPEFELNDQLKKEIIQLVKENTQQYRQKYNYYFVQITKKLKEADREFDFDKVDRESKRRAGGDTLKDDVTQVITPEIISKVEGDFPEDEKSKMITTKVAEKVIEGFIGKTVDKIMDLATEREKKNLEKNEET